MKHLLMTTAIVALTALPVMAQMSDNVQTGDAAQSAQGQAAVQAQVQAQMDLRENVEAADLIGKRIFLSRQAATQQGQESDQLGSQAGAGADAQPGTEQDLATETQLEQRGADSQTGNVTSGTNGMQVTPPTADGTDARPGTRQDLATQTQLEQSRGMSGSDEDRPRMVGVITDVILNADGDAVGLVVDAGGYLGIAANEIRLPMEDVSFVPDHQLGLQQMGQQEGTSTQDLVAFYVVYIGDPAALQLSQDFDDAQAAELGETRGSSNWGQLEQDWEEISFTSVTIDDLLGVAVYGGQNEWIAEISEMSLDQGTQIENIIIDVGGYLGIGSKPVALSMEDIQLRVYGGSELRAYIPYSQDQLDNMAIWESDSAR